jgi:hypothetical protein
MSDQTPNTIEAPKVTKLNIFNVSIETTDALYFVGLICLLAGLGIAIGWGWGLAAVGAILTGTGLWSVSTPPLALKEHD